MKVQRKRKAEAIKISKKASILDALKMMDETFKRLLLVMDGEYFLNILSIGDIQRAIIKNVSLETSIEKILRKNTLISNISDSVDVIRKRMLEKRIECMPVISDDGKISDVWFWEDVFEDVPQPIEKEFNLPVVIMAGGEGQRLRPITYVLPKALIPLGKKSMLEMIIESFFRYGCTNYYISVNYKAEMIEKYMHEVNKGLYNIDFIKEIKPLGTAGSLFELKNKIDSTFIVSNCDILVKNDYSAILDYHYSNKNELTIVSALNHFSIPYGIIETKNDGILDKIVEKPNYTFQINSGMYILEPQVLDEIPKDAFFHMTDLIEILNQKGRKVGVFPVSEKSWVDIGNWSEYMKSSIE